MTTKEKSSVLDNCLEQVLSFRVYGLIIAAWIGWWNSSGGRKLWLHLMTDYSPFALVGWGTFLLSTGVFWLYAMPWTLMDFGWWPKRLTCARLQPSKTGHLKLASLKKASVAVIRNQLLLTLPASLLLGFLWPHINTSSLLHIPAPWIFVRDLAVFLVVEETGFYFSHRLLHSPRFYARFHKLHHDFTAPIAVAALYAHPVEHLFSSLLPVSLGPLLMNTHVLTLWLWGTLVVMNIVHTHSGYKWSWMVSARDHDDHHKVFNKNFGVLGIWDRLLNTHYP